MADNPPARTAPSAVAADELHADACISDATWATLAARCSIEQLMDVVFCVGQYVLISMAVNSFGVEIEEWADDQTVANRFRSR